MPKSRDERSQAKATRKLAERSEETSLGKLAERTHAAESVSSGKLAKKKGTLHHFPSKKAERHKSEKLGPQKAEESGQV